MMRKTILLAAWMGMCLTAQAQTAKEEIANNRFLCASNYLDYDNYPATKPLTKAPKGYEPYYLTHYGRHGSRWLLSDGDYMDNIKTLRKAQQLGKLTAKGEETLQKLERFYPCTVKRLGDLTTVGERQHHGIGRRMAQHFPEIFLKKNVGIDARSTVVTRCILSMTAECEELQGANPTVRIHNDVSESLQYYLNQSRSRLLRETSRKGQGKAHEYRMKYTHPERLTTVLFNDQQYVKDSVNAGHLMRSLFDVAANMQSHDTDIELLSLFTDEELYDQWRIRNVGWFVDYANTPITDGLMPFSQENLLENIIQTADTVKQVQATLRFGHEVCVMPLACLLELDNCGKSISDLDHLDDVWRNYNIFPMACNIQLVFYRPKKGKSGDILVKALLNERETTMPVPTNQWPYYKWSDLRKYYKGKLAQYNVVKKEYEGVKK